ncbi:hypothetical protein STEG23_016658 [Scotinomys teguina]
MEGWLCSSSPTGLGERRKYKLLVVMEQQCEKRNIWCIMCYLFCAFTPLEVNFTGTYVITRGAQAPGSHLDVCRECEHSAKWIEYTTCNTDPTSKEIVDVSIQNQT